MCPTDKHTIIELRSEDAQSLLPGTAQRNTQVRFTDMDFRGILNDHPEGDKGLWNVKVVSFSLYQAQGITNAETIDINIKQLTSPFVLSSKRRRGLTVGNASCNLLRDVDNTTGEEILPVGFNINANEGFETTCRVDFTNWEVRLYSNRDDDLGIAEDGTPLESNVGGSNSIINNWTCRLEFSPYVNHNRK